MTRSTSRLLVVAALLIGCAACASADSVYAVWTLDATFTDGLTAVGTFTTSGGSSSVSPSFVSWDVTFSGGTLEHDFIDSSSTAPPGAILTEFPPNSSWPTGTDELLGFASEPGFTPYVDFFLGSVLTNAGGTMTLLGADSCDGTCYVLDAQADNTLTGITVPEPSAIVFLGTLLSILGAMASRRRRRVS